MKKSVSSYIVDNGARLSKIYDLAEEYAFDAIKSVFTESEDES